MTIQNNSSDLIQFLIHQANSGSKDWFGFKQQKIAGIDVAYKIAINHADKMSPEEVTDYVVKLNNSIFSKLLKG